MHPIFKLTRTHHRIIQCIWLNPMRGVYLKDLTPAEVRAAQTMKEQKLITIKGGYGGGKKLELTKRGRAIDVPNW